MNNTRVFRFLSIALLAAIALYFAAQGYFALTDPFTTTLVYQSSAEDTIDVSGWLVRDEEVLSGESGTVRHEVSEGERVGKGQTVATVYSGSDALDTVQQIESKELQLQQLQFALSSYLNPDATLKLDGSITESLLSIRRSLSGGDYDDAADQTAQLKAAILKRSHSYSSSEEIQSGIDQVKSEISRLRALLSGAVSVRAEKPGIYSAACDGYEDVLTPDTLADLTVGRLENLTAGSKGSSLGKLIYGYTWYYAAAVTNEQAAQLRTGQSVTLRFAKGLDADVPATVYSIGEDEGGRQLLVLCCDRYLPQTTQLRHQQAELVLSSYSGIRVPANALRVNDEGQAGVYCVVGSLARFKPVDIVYQGDGYTLVRASKSAEGSAILRAGDEVVVTASDIEPGKVIE